MPVGEFVLRGLSLVDTRTTTSRQVTLSTEGQYRLVHSGDVKIYENLDVLPRAFITHQAEVISDPDQAIARLRDPGFDPSQIVVLTGGQPLKGEGNGTAEVVRYTPEEIIIEARTDSPGYLILADSFYPGWKATVDGQPVEILRADIMFRAVRLEPGEHQIVFRYEPAAVWWGARVSGGALLLWIMCFILLLRRRSDPSPMPALLQAAATMSGRLLRNPFYLFSDFIQKLGCKVCPVGPFNRADIRVESHLPEKVYILQRLKDLAVEFPCQIHLFDNAIVEFQFQPVVSQVGDTGDMQEHIRLLTLRAVYSLMAFALLRVPNCPTTPRDRFQTIRIPCVAPALTFFLVRSQLESRW
jgi:hypothetical protein